MWLTLLADEEISRPLFGLELSGKRQRAVVELLLVEANRPVSVERIIDEVWPEAPPRTARNSVQRFVADIRKSLGDDRDRLQTSDAGYMLQVREGELDIDEVDRLRSTAARRSDSPAEAASMLREALNYFGSLGRVGYTETGQAALRTHEELQLQILEECIEFQIAAGGADTVIEELDALTRRHPYRERFWGQLMRSLATTGRRVEALRAYDQVRRKLIDDVGLDPSPELQAIQTLILAEPDDGLVGSDKPKDGPASSAGTAVAPSDVPMPASLIGRRADFERVCALLETNQLVTIAGPGGVGKTTLARVVAEATSNGSGPEAAIVRLAEVQSGDEIVTAVAAAMGLEVQGSASDAVQAEVIDTLAMAPRLVVLDNAEHVVDATASFAEQIVQRTESRVIVTSRQRLGLVDEWLHPLRGLSTPSAETEGDSESEQLFVRRAAALGVDVSDVPQAIATVCSRLDGLPLAIELVAGQLEHLGVRDLLDRLDSLLHMRAARSSSERHASLASLLQWSWDLLSPVETEVVERFAVFAGRLDARALASVAGQDHDVVASLVAKSLVTSTIEDGRAYYSLPMSVRAFANGQAREKATIAQHRDAHAEFLLTYLRQWSVVELNAWHDSIAAASRYAPEYGVALEWLDQCDRHDELIELATRTTGLWGRRGPRADLLRWSQRCSELATGTDLEPEAAAGVTVMGLEAAFRFANYDIMSRYGAQLEVTEAQQPTDIGTPLLGFYGAALHCFNLGSASLANIEAAHARAPHTETAELNIAQTRMWLGCSQLMNRSFEEALASYRSVLDITTRPGGTVLWAELGLASVLLLLERLDEAQASFAKLTSGADESVWNYATAIVGAVLTAARGEPELARNELQPAALKRMSGRKGAPRNDFQIGFGIIAHYADEPELAADLLADPMPQSPVMAALLFNHLHQERMPAAAWQRLWAQEMSARILSSIRVSDPDAPPVDRDLHRWWPGGASAGYSVA